MPRLRNTDGEAGNPVEGMDMQIMLPCEECRTMAVGKSVEKGTEHLPRLRREIADGRLRQADLLLLLEKGCGKGDCRNEERGENKMRYASVCSGVEAASLAWMPLGWEAVWFSEIEPFPCAVLKHRFPEVPNLGDMTKIKVETIENETGKLQRFTTESGEDVVVPGGVDLLVGGTPCQSFSFAGNRSGLRGVSGLALTYCKLLEAMHPRWFVWENVPGVFSSNGGEDFKTILKAFDDIGYSCAWRVLDAQYTRVDGYPRAVPQRRRRVFVVGYSGDWRYPASVLFEPGCLPGDTPPSRTKGQTAPSGAEGGIDTAKSIRMRAGKPGGGTGALIGDDLSHTLATGNDQTVVYTVHGAQTPISNDDHANALGCSNSGLENCVCISKQKKPEGRFWNGEDVAGTLTVTSDRQLMPDKGRLQCVIEPREDSVECLDTRQVDVHDTDLAPTLIATDYKGGKAICYENHAQDSRIKPYGEYSPQINAKAGTGAQVELAYTQNATGVMGVCNTTQGENQNADAEKARAVKILRLLRDEIGEKAFCEWTLGRLGSFQAEKVLQPNLHGESVRREAGEEKTRLDDSALSCAKNNAKNALRCLWEQFQLGHPSQGQELAQQFTAELNLRLSQLPHEIASVATVRRLLPIETERLMGFPDNHTRIPWRGKPVDQCPDGHRYKACGNSMCVNVMRWIGMRIEFVERRMK